MQQRTISVLRFARRTMIALSLMPACSTAQPPVKSDDATIIVTGRQLSREEATEVASSYTRAVLAVPPLGQYARWKSPICPNVVGLSSTLAASVAQKIRAEAAAAGAQVARPTCKPNLEVIFTDDADNQVSAILRKSARVVDRNTSPADRVQLTRSGRPVRWWYVAKAEGMDGHQLTGQSAMMLSAQIPGGEGPGINSRGNDQYLDGYSTTLIGSRIRSNFESLFVVVDLTRAEGRSLGAVAAYVSMVSLAQIRMNFVSRDDTILSLFDADRAPQDLSPVDRAFLKAVYSTPPNRDQREQAGAIRAKMVRFLATQ